MSDTEDKCLTIGALLVAAAEETRIARSEADRMRVSYEGQLRNTLAFKAEVDKLRTELADAVAAEREACKHALDALEATQKIVVDGALTGFNHQNGNWAERLYTNQQTISSAIAAIRARGTE